MNKELYQKIKQTIIDKDCLYQIDKNKQASIIHNISAYVAEMLENKEQNVEIKLYNYDEFLDKCSKKLCVRFFDDFDLQNKGRNHLTYYTQHIEYWSKLLNDELNVVSNLYDFKTFKDTCSVTLYQYFCDECSNDGYSVCSESDIYYNKFEQFWSDLLTKELNEETK